jgi:hypothetical protein
MILDTRILKPKKVLFNIVVIILNACALLIEILPQVNNIQKALCIGQVTFKISLVLLQIWHEFMLILVANPILFALLLKAHRLGWPTTKAKYLQ